jgi:hypothetical protein
MFQNCIALKRVESIEATNLAESCYAYMFAGCSYLTEIGTIICEQ